MPFQLMVPGRYGIPYYGPPRFILLLAQPEHLRPEQTLQQPPRIQVIRAEEMPMQMWQRIALPPQFIPPTAVVPAPPTAVPATATSPIPATAIPTAPPFIVQAYQQQWW